MKTLALSVLILTLLVSAAPASVTVGNITVDWVKGVAPNGMDGYIVSISSSAGVMQAFDGGFTGPFNQVPGVGAWPDSPFEPWEVGDPNDTHFILSKTGTLPVSGTITESATSLYGTIGWAGDYQVSSVQLAQIVVPTGQSFTFAATVAIGGQDNPFNVPIPEPATMALLAFGAIGLLRRRNGR